MDIKMLVDEKDKDFSPYVLIDGVYNRNGTAVRASDLGGAAATHSHAASQVTAGTLGGQVLANAAAQGNAGTPQLRNIYAGTGAMTAGASALASGAVYCQYE